jgi:hypothetical protein
MTRRPRLWPFALLDGEPQDFRFLKNRRPAQWRDVQKVDHTVRLRSPAEILEDLRQDVIAMRLVPAPEKPDGSDGM